MTRGDGLAETPVGQATVTRRILGMRALGAATSTS